MYRTFRTKLVLAALAALTFGALRMSARAFAQADDPAGPVGRLLRRPIRTTTGSGGRRRE